MEVIHGINTGTITPTNTEYLVDLKESFGLTEEAATQVFNSIVEQQIRISLEKMDRFLLRGRDDECVSEIQKILCYTSFVGGDVSDVLKSTITNEIKERIVSIFDNSIGSELEEMTIEDGGGEDVMKEQRGLLLA